MKFPVFHFMFSSWNLPDNDHDDEEEQKENEDVSNAGGYIWKTLK